MFVRPAIVALALTLAGAASGAVSVGIGELIGERVEDLNGDPVGYVREFIVDMSDGRVLYMVVRGGNEFYTLPLRAIRRISPHNEPQVDTSLRGPDVAKRVETDARFRRVRRLIGETIALPDTAGSGRIYDLDFEPDTGLITQVIVSTGDGKRAYPREVLLHGVLPPASRSPG
jgi:sporulation protein YlmC with PRC-barrel domain